MFERVDAVLERAERRLTVALRWARVGWWCWWVAVATRMVMHAATWIALSI